MTFANFDISFLQQLDQSRWFIWLVRGSHVVASWKLRYFVVTSDSFSYFVMMIVNSEARTNSSTTIQIIYWSNFSQSFCITLFLYEFTFRLCGFWGEIGFVISVIRPSVLSFPIVDDTFSTPNLRTIDVIWFVWHEERTRHMLQRPNNSVNKNILAMHWIVRANYSNGNHSAPTVDFIIFCHWSSVVLNSRMLAPWQGYSQSNWLNFMHGALQPAIQPIIYTWIIITSFTQHLKWLDDFTLLSFSDPAGSDIFTSIVILDIVMVNF